MKTLLNLAFLCCCLCLSQSVLGEDFCREQAKKLGNKSGFKRISKRCLNEVKNSSQENPGLVAVNKDRGLSVRGHKNFIIIDKGSPKVNYIGGKMTRLNEILAIGLSANGNDIAVLNESVDGEQELLIFTMGLLGNVIPDNVIRHENLSKISSLSFSSDGSEVYLVSRADKVIYSVEKSGDIRSKSPSKVVKSDKLISLTDKVKQIKVRGAEILLLTDENFVKSYSKVGTNLWNLNLTEAGVTEPKDFDVDLGELNIYEDSGEVRILRKPASTE